MNYCLWCDRWSKYNFQLIHNARGSEYQGDFRHTHMTRKHEMSNYSGAFFLQFLAEIISLSFVIFFSRRVRLKENEEQKITTTKMWYRLLKKGELRI